MLRTTLLGIFLWGAPFAVAVPIASGAPCTTGPDAGLSHYLVSADGKPQPALRSLFSLFALAPPGDFGEATRVMKERWARAPGVERWQIKEVYDDKSAALRPLFEQLGMFCEKRATGRRYRYALLLGSIVPRVRSRIEFLVEEWKRGVRFDTVVLLGASRRLDPVQDKLDDGTTVKNEIQMMEHLWERAELPTELRKVKRVSVESPDKTDAQGKKIRAETVDTIVTWMAMRPAAGTALMVSSQPFIGYQHEVVQPAFAPGFALETVGGAAAPESLKPGVGLDNVAQWALRLQARRNR